MIKLFEEFINEKYGYYEIKADEVEDIANELLSRNDIEKALKSIGIDCKIKFGKWYQMQKGHYSHEGYTPRICCDCNLDMTTDEMEEWKTSHPEDAALLDDINKNNYHWKLENEAGKKLTGKDYVNFFSIWSPRPGDVILTIEINACNKKVIKFVKSKNNNSQHHYTYAN